MTILKNIFLIGSVVSYSLLAQQPTANAEGPKLLDQKEAIAKVFPDHSSVKEIEFTPLQNGGMTFIGLVTRLLGDSVHREHEGLQTKRFLYHVYKGNDRIGIVHGSGVDIEESKKAQVFIFYNSDSSIRDLRVDGLSENVLLKLNEGNYLEQFLGKKPADFEVERGKRGRIRNRGTFFTAVKKPRESSLARVFDKIVRAVRYNVSFMDVAFFITQHPDISAVQSSSSDVPAVSSSSQPR